MCSLLHRFIFFPLLSGRLIPDLTMSNYEVKEEFEDTKGVIEPRKSKKVRKHKGQKKKY